MASVNRVVLIGHVTRDFSVKYTGGDSGGTAIIEFGIALNSREKVNGEWQDRADFFDVTMFGDQAEHVAKRVGKGSLVGVEGRLRLDRWEKDGQKHSRVRVIATNVEWLGGKSRGAAQTGDGGDWPPPEPSDFGDANF